MFAWCLYWNVTSPFLHFKNFVNTTNLLLHWPSHQVLLAIWYGSKWNYFQNRKCFLSVQLLKLKKKTYLRSKFNQSCQPLSTNWAKKIWTRYNASFLLELILIDFKSLRCSKPAKLLKNPQWGKTNLFLLNGSFF